jgi:hypothetical protein
MNIDKNLLYQNPLLPKRNRCTIGKNIPPKFDIFPLRNIRTAIVFVANTHAHVGRTRTAHAQAGKMDSVSNTAEKRLRMRGNKKDGEEFKCRIINKNMAI